MLRMAIGERIQSRLQTIEQQEGVVILLAVESGSRAWGFPSADSDFDVRFVFCRHPDFYLSIDFEQQPDVIERPIEDSIDLSGWDIRKALSTVQEIQSTTPRMASVPSCVSGAHVVRRRTAGAPA